MSVHLGAVVLCLVAGFAIAVQVAVNSEFGRRVGVLEASGFSAAITAMLLLGAAVATGGASRIVEGFRVPPWLWIGGLCGAIVLAAIAFAPPRLGVFATMAILLAVQLGAGLVFDAMGAFGLERVPVDPWRIAGLLLMLGGALLLLRR